MLPDLQAGTGDRTGKLKAQRGIGGAHLDPQTELGTHRTEVQSCGSCGPQLPSREPRAHNPCSPHLPDLKERPLFPLNVLVKLFLKNSNLISAELRERNVWSPLPGRLRGSAGEGDSLHSGWTLPCAHSHPGQQSSPPAPPPLGGKFLVILLCRCRN